MEIRTKKYQGYTALLEATMMTTLIWFSKGSENDFGVPGDLNLKAPSNHRNHSSAQLQIRPLPSPTYLGVTYTLRPNN
ncbi:hypothetical protein ACTXT7_013593 [Hymenolepis weldensis]